MAKRKKNRPPKLSPSAPEIALPPSGLLLPVSPHQIRMRDLRIPRPIVESPVIKRILERPAVKAAVRAKQRYARKLVLSKLYGGSGFQLSEQLRWYFQEYVHRLWSWGPDFLPSSFNVVEAFLTFDQEFYYFVLRQEKEYLLGLDDYWDWYAKSKTAKSPRLVLEAIEEGVIHSFEMPNDPAGFKIKLDTPDGPVEQVIAGVSFVRHGHELSCMLLAGENPPLHTGDVVKDLLEEGTSAPGREKVKPDAEYTTEDKYLSAFPGFGKVVVLGRFDLRDGKYDVRYVCVDEGPTFNVLTDDPVIHRQIENEFRDFKLAENIKKRLSRYDDLFSALSTLIYLPVYFEGNSDIVKPLVVTTRLKAEAETKEFKDIIKSVGKANCLYDRTICCLPMSSRNSDSEKLTIQPPEMSFESKGYWKPIGPQDIGQDQAGGNIVGRTWVSRQEIWSELSLKSYLVERPSSKISGPDPGEVYVQRSPAHEKNLYKIGLTRRDSDTRSKELSAATGVALPFLVLASWHVGDCGRVEKLVHEKLAKYRVNPNREFFFADLHTITTAIAEVVEQL